MSNTTLTTVSSGWDTEPENAYSDFFNIGVKSYFPAGQVSNVTSIAGTNTYSLDAADRVSVLESASIGGNLRFQYSYNTNNGLVSSMTCTNTGVIVSYGFDVMDRVTNITWKTASSSVLRSFAYQYNSASMITNISLEDGARMAYSYDDLDRLSGESRSEISNQTYAIAYGWDEVGNRLVKTNGSTTVNYSYSNNCNRLTGWTASSTNDFIDLRKGDISGYSTETIGTNSNLGQLYVSNSVASVAPSVSGVNFTAGSFVLAAGTNQIVAAIGDQAGNVGYATNTITLNVVTNATYLHNSAGCVTNIAYSGSGYSENIGLSWNSQYQLTAVSTNGSECERNGYDALGRRVWNWNGTETNYFVYDGNQIIADVDATGGLRRAYVWGPGVDNLLAMTVYTGATVKTYFYITDHLGSVHAIADESGSIVESYRYDAWGRVLGVYNGNGQPQNQSAIGNRYLWQGREYYWSVGLYDFRARVYDPISGRFLSKDPIGITGGLNEYTFCGNNPVNFRDPSGLLYDLLSGAATSGYERGGVLGTLQAWGACAGTALLDTIGGRVIESTFTRSGYAAGEGCTGKAWKWGIAGTAYGIFDAFTIGRGANVAQLAKEFTSFGTFKLYELGARVYPTAVFKAFGNLGNAERGAALIAKYGSAAAVKAVSASTPLLTRVGVYFTTTPTPAGYFVQLASYLGVNAGGSSYLDLVAPQ